jgi:soluble lytic murein transglycosylase-like protein
MLRRPALLGGVLRLVAVGVGGVAIAILLQRGRVERFSAPALATPVTEIAAEFPASAAPASWAFASSGWYIRVNGVTGATRADAAIAAPPSKSGPPTASVPRPSTPAISPFDRVIARHAKAEGFDWRLVAALIFEESGFNPTSRSDKGAYGLMQVRPIAAESVGAVHFTAPDDNVRTGVRYLRQLDAIFRAAPGQDRLRLVLAAYNMGPGHVRDAQMLAAYLGYDPRRWDHSMEDILPLLEEPSIYLQLPNGFAKGSQTVAYVQRILARYQRYKLKTATAPGVDADASPSMAAGSSDG